MPEYRLKNDLGFCKAGLRLIDYHILEVGKYKEKYKVMFGEDELMDYHSFYKEEIPLLIEQGYIEEVQEPKYTKNDMIDFFKYINHKYLMEENLPYHTILKEYEKRSLV